MRHQLAGSTEVPLLHRVDARPLLHVTEDTEVRLLSTELTRHRIEAIIPDEVKIRIQ